MKGSICIMCSDFYSGPQCKCQSVTPLEAAIVRSVEYLRKVDNLSGDFYVAARYILGLDGSQVDLDKQSKVD